MRKEEFIAKYGQEAWDKKMEKHREISRRSAKKLYHEDLERSREKAREKRASNSEREKERDKRYRDKHKTKRNAYNKQYREEHLDYFQKYSNTLNYKALRLLHNYKRYDEEHGLGGFNLTKEFILGKILASSCIYCGDSNWEHLGCDRVDNTKGHTTDNVVCSCSVCNAQRSDRFTVEEFVKYRQAHPMECDKFKSDTL